jgi:hypothetical protein
MQKMKRYSKSHCFFLFSGMSENDEKILNVKQSDTELCQDSHSGTF